MNATFRRILPIAALIAVVLVPVACSSTGTDRAGKAVESADKLRAEFAELKVRIDQAAAAMDGVREPAEEQTLKAAYDGYVKALGRLDSQGKTVLSRSKDLRTNGAKYIQGWEAQMAEVENEELRALAGERRAEAEKELAAAADELDRIKTDLRAFRKGLEDIRIVLENDLNAAGVAALSGPMDKAKASAEPAKKDIDGIMAGLEKISAAFSASGGSQPK